MKNKVLDKTVGGGKFSQAKNRLFHSFRRNQVNVFSKSNWLHLFFIREICNCLPENL